MDYLLFLLICIVATFTPGPAIFLAVKNTAIYGLKKALSGMLGNVLAMLSMAALSAAGLSTVILTSEYLYLAIKILGGSYLIYLGIQYWISDKSKVITEESYTTCKSNLRLFLESYLVGVTNPKAIAFYTALFPQFLNVEQPIMPQFFALSLTFACFSFSALCSYALVTSKFASLFSRSHLSSLINRAAGTIFIGFGISLLSSNKA
ncbi:LysE family translocator [Vibrio sp. MEBiC08052]|uniref:LysE family translocator n=1 Tax=Vibrio sp. MEBiC08052 TaxID=1761910 RepID=UPI000740FF52|nr:LysE family translocator [Vibrio sp. MEBiC08052]